MQAVVTGGSGLLGGNLAVALIDAGWSVRAVRRGSARVDHLARWPIAWVDGDLSDADSLVRAVDGADAVFHCAAMVSVRSRPTPALVDANVGGTRRLIAAIRRAGVRRMVHCSSVSAIGASDDGTPCTEATRFDLARHGLDDGYAITKHQAEELVRAEVAAGGLDAVIANPTFLLGPLDRRPSSGRVIVEVVRGRVPGYTDGINNFVDVRDVARGMIAVHDRGETGERYILGRESATWGELFRTIARVAGVRPPRFRVPRWATLALGRLGDLQERLTDAEVPLNSVQARYAWTTAFQFSSERARTELGYTAGPIEPAIADAIAFFRSVGIL
ncbi:MAG: NAD-dependent epimerase/dehydratase family protein [Myxococcota bacterium]